MANENILKILNNLKQVELKNLNKIEKMITHPENVEYWDDHGDGGYWKPLTDEFAKAEDEYPWTLQELRMGDLYYLVATDTGIRLLNEEYSTFMGDTQILLHDSLQACKDFIKIL